MAPLDERRRKIKEAFLAKRGRFAPWHDAALRLDPDFFQAFFDSIMAPLEHGPLPMKVKELVFVAVDGSATHLYRQGLQVHIAGALKHGATAAEVMEVLELASLIGLHACAVGAPMLAEELGKLGRAPAASPRAAQLKAEFMAAAGYWDEGFDAIATLAPDFFAAWVRMAVAPLASSVLEPKVKALICLALDAATTLLYQPGMRLHMRRALELGATPNEVMEVLELASAIGIHSVSLGVPALMEELDKAGKPLG